GGGGRADVARRRWGRPPGALRDRGKNTPAVRGDRQWFWTEQTRSEVLARHGVVATSQPLATQAGLDILKHGGNAADAAVATAAMLGLVEPESATIGGGMGGILYSAKKHKLFGLQAPGAAPGPTARHHSHTRSHDQ